MRKNLTRALFALALIAAPAAYADGPGDAGPDVAAPPVQTQAQPQAPAAETASAPQGQSGAIQLQSSDVALNIPEGYLFYSADEARAYLQRANAAEPQGSILGMIARAGDDIRAPGTWATIVTYDAIGYVQPETASGLTDANFETSVRDARATQGRRFEGFAAAPAFDAASGPHMAWAERTLAPGSQGKDLRYEQKLLGRHGVAGLTSIGALDQMPEIEAAAAALRGMLSFPVGRTHADFQPASDAVSTYSVPGLVTGVPNAAPAAEIAAAQGETQTNFGGLAGWFPWVALGVIALAIIGFLFMRRKRNDDEAHA